jgi:hypothetical protein
LKQNGVEIILEDHIAKTIDSNRLLQIKEFNTSISSGIDSAIHRNVSEASTNALINSFTNKAAEGSKLAFEVNGEGKFSIFFFSLFFF